MRVMGVKGLTLYHLKSHLQKFRLGKQPHKEFNDHSMKDGERAASLELRNNASSSGMLGLSMNEMQMEVNRRLHEQLEVQRHLQLRIEAQGKYMQTILEKACQTLAGENMAAAAAVSGCYSKTGMGPEISGLKDFGPGPMNFPSLQDLNIYGGPSSDHHQLNLHHISDRPSIDAFMPAAGDVFLNTKKRPNPYSNINNTNGKSPLIWADDLRLQELGSAAAVSCLDDNQIQIPALSVDRGGAGSDIDSVSDIYEAKPMMSGEHSMAEKNKYDGKMDRLSPRAAAISAGGVTRGRSSPFV